MPTEDEIRALCLLVLQARCNDEFAESLHTLRSALAEHFLAMENLAIHMLLNRPKQTPVTFAKDQEEALMVTRSQDEDKKEPEKEPKD